MLRRSIGLSICLGFLWAAAGAWSGQPERPSGEYLLPNTTAGFLTVTNYDQFKAQWDKTQIGHLMNDPVMKAFRDDMDKQLEQRWARIERRLGLSLEDLKKLPGGEVDVALIRPAPGRAANAILVDCTGHLDEAKEVLGRVTQRLTSQGAKKTKRVVNKIEVLYFDMPKSDDGEAPKRAPEAAPKKPPATTTKKPAGAAGKPKTESYVERDQAAYFLKDNLLVATDDFQVIEGIIARLTEKRQDSLGDLPGFQEVMQRCQADYGPGVPQARWFIHPISYADASRASTPEDRRRPGKSILELLQNQGFSAVQGVGGFADFAPKEGFELIHRTAICAPPPYEKSMRMLVFPNGKDYAPQRWVPRDIATYTTFYLDIANAFDNFGPLFGELFGNMEPVCAVGLTHRKDLDAGKLTLAFRQAVEEATKARVKIPKSAVLAVKTPGSQWAIYDKPNNETYMVQKGVRKKIAKDSAKITRETVLRVSREVPGIWEEALKGMKTQPRGPQIDLGKELIEHLGQRVTMLTDYQVPEPPDTSWTTSERLLFAIETTNDKEVAAAVEKLMKSDPPPKKYTEPDCIIWEAAEPEPAEAMAPPVVSIPSLNLGHQKPPEEKEEGRQRLLPHLAVTVIDGHVLVASHREFLLKVLKVLRAKERRESLGNLVDYQMVNEVIVDERFGFKAVCGRMFSRTEAEYRPTYELIRQGKMPEAQTLLARLLNTFSAEGRKGEMRHQRIEGKNLPPYDVVRHYLGPAGLAATSEANGWFFKGFTLTKEAE